MYLGKVNVKILYLGNYSSLGMTLSGQISVAHILIPKTIVSLLHGMRPVTIASLSQDGSFVNGHTPNLNAISSSVICVLTCFACGLKQVRVIHYSFPHFLYLLYQKFHHKSNHYIILKLYLHNLRMEQSKNGKPL